MATTKQVGSKKGAAKDKKAGAAAPAQPAAHAPEKQSKTRAVLDKLLAQRAPLTNAERAAFHALMTDAQADALGKKTRAADVLAEGLRWAAIMDTALRTYPGALAGYSSLRFAWYLDRLSALDHAIAEEGAQRKRRGAARDSASSVRDAVLTARDTLVSRMQTFAGRREAERASLAGAIGTADTDEKLSKSMATLLPLAREWLARKDDVSAILAGSAGLTADIVEEAAAAAKAFASTSADASLEGPAHAKDSPDVNRAEGRMLAEMFEARRLFNEANAKNGLVPKLVPGRSLRHVFGLKAGRGGAEVEEGPSEEVGGAAEVGTGEAKDAAGPAKVADGAAKPK